ncbi:MAG: holdfast anchor protein HfaD [Hyphomonas sp.]|nr:holdfast anchor protein HfaD [Hyphomonas sp.]
MARKTRHFTATAIAAALAAAPLAGADPIIIDQVQLNGTLGALIVEVPGEADAATAVATAVGNTAAGLLDSGSIDAVVTQQASGDSFATAELRGGTVWGPATIASTAYGNAATGSTWAGDIAADVTQTMSADTTALATTRLDTAGSVTSAATAAANVLVTANDYGTASGTQTQLSEGDVSAWTNASVLRNTQSATWLTTASGNNLTSAGSSATRLVTSNQTTADGTTVAAGADIYMQDGNNVSSALTAAGNSVTVTNEWGYASLGLEGGPAEQLNGADIEALSAVELDHWSGYAVSSSYGVGNSAAVSNVGADTAMYTAQVNTGDVTSGATLTGQSWVGGTGAANAVAIGNAASAFLCNLCGDSAVYGSANQVNSGATTAYSYVNTPVAGAIMGSATAIGNSATFASGDGN